MIAGLGTPASARDLYRAVHFQFGLEKRFVFDGIVFSGGSHDIYSLTSNARTNDRLTLPACIRRHNKRVNGREYVKLRNQYLNELRLASNADILDLGCGFPKRSEAVIRRSDFRTVGAEDDFGLGDSAVDLYAWCRQEAIERLDNWGPLVWKGATTATGERAATTILPFPMPFHEVSQFYLPIESHVCRVVMHDINSLTHFAWTKKWVNRNKLKGIRLCAGTPK
jgi:hypothetical protein